MALPQDANRLTTTQMQGSLNALLKNVYADKIENIRPVGQPLQDAVSFIERSKYLGAKYVVPVITGYEFGFTFATSGEDAFLLNNAVPGSVQSAEVSANSIVLRSLLGYQAASRAVTDENAFEDAVSFVLKNMSESVAHVLEIVLWHGQTNIGVVQLTNLVNENPDGTTNTGAAANTILQLSDESWADFIWAGAEGMKLSFFSSTTLTVSPTVVTIDMDKRWVTVDTAITGTVIGQTLHIFGSRVAGGAYKEGKGLISILQEKTILFNIPLTGAGSSSLFAPNETTAFGIPSFNKIINLVKKAVAKGLKKNVIAYVPHAAWNFMMTEQAASRVYDSSYKPEEMKQGAKSIKFFGLNGEIEVMACGYCKNGQIVIIAPEDYVRIGSADVTFKMPGGGEDDFFRSKEDYAAYEMRCWSDQNLFTCRGGHSVLATGVVYA